jgi:phenylacetate-CoA ligase
MIMSHHEATEIDKKLSGFGDIDLLRTVLATRAGGATLEDLASLPTVAKADLLADQQACPPFGTRLLRPVSELGMLVESSGSTGGPKEVHALSRQDAAAAVTAIAGSLAEIGIGAGDVVALTLPVGPAGGGLKIMLALQQVGALVLRIGPLSSEEKLKEIRTYRAKVIVGTPGYVDTLRGVLEHFGVSPLDLGVRTLLVATQAMSIDWLQQTERVWGARVHEWYGNAAGMFAMTCRGGALRGPDRHGCLHWDPRNLFVEIRDGEDRLVADGERGQLILTHLQNTTAPLLRYRTGDEGRFVVPGSCPCGSDRPGIESGTVRRVDAMVKLRGVNVWPAAVDAVTERAGVSTYWAVLRTDEAGRERAALYVRPMAQAGVDVDLLAQELRREIGVGFEVVCWDEPSPPNFVTTSAAGKQSQWIDLRATSAGA